jgi:ABC-type lipoprotein release transport system permease subunit
MDVSDGKSKNANRTIELTPAMTEIINLNKAYLKAKNIDVEYLFPTRDGEPSNAGYLTRAWSRLMQGTGIKLTLYEIRHTYISLMIDKLPLKELQRMMGREGQVTGFVLTANADVPEGRSSAALGKALEAALPGIAAVPARDYVEQDVILRLAKSMAWATSLVALILGSVGMLNTMVMSVFERTTEIGVLRALGWRRGRVLKLVLGEALVLGVVGALLGGLLGYLGLHALTLAPTARGFINPVIPPATYAFGLALAVGLSLLGGLYPAWHASQLEPTEALRHD